MKAKKYGFTRQGSNLWTGGNEKVTESKTLLNILYYEMPYIIHDKRATYGHSSKIYLRSVASSILVCYVLLELPRWVSVLH